MTDTKTAPQVRKPRGQYAKTGAKREAILDAALEVFAESGYRAGSLRDIATRVEMSEAGLLHHFKNKSELLATVLDRLAAAGRLDPAVDSMRAAVATLAFMDGLQVQWLLDRSVVDMAPALAEYFRGFVKGFDSIDADDPEADYSEDAA